MTNHDLADAVGLSPSPCSRRLRILEEMGVIQGFSAHVDAKAYGLPVIVFVQVSLTVHSGRIVKQFEEAIQRCPEVQECHVVTGAADYLLRVMAKDLEDYERFVRVRLHEIGGVSSINTSFVYGTVKREHVFPEV